MADKDKNWQAALAAIDLSSIDALKTLKQEHDQLDGRVSSMEEMKAGFSEAVYQRVRDDYMQRLRGLDEKHPTVLLSHQPIVLDLPESQKVSLILSGHTHGGQINLPLLGPPARFATKDLKYAHGLFRRGETQLYVSSGTGVIGLHVRLGVRPEIAVLVLRNL